MAFLEVQPKNPVIGQTNPDAVDTLSCCRTTENMFALMLPDNSLIGLDILLHPWVGVKKSLGLDVIIVL